jgi:Protein of unknown function (DUF2000)
MSRLVRRASACSSRRMAVSSASRGVISASFPYDYLAELAGISPDELGICAFSLVGPRNRVDKITRKLALLP